MTQKNAGPQPPQTRGPDPSPPGSDADTFDDGSCGDTWPYVERRRHADRRDGPTPFWSAFVGRRRRRHGRRAGERDGIYVDRFTRRDVLLVVAILLLNIFDALFTLIWLQRGGAEGNPLMVFLLEYGNSAFLVQKCLVVGAWLLLLVVHKNFPLARLGLWSLAGIYSLLILYHFALMATGVDPRHGPGHSAAAIGEMIPSEEASEQRGDGGFDAQGSLAESQRIEARTEQPLDLVVAPPTLRTDRQ